MTAGVLTWPRSRPEEVGSGDVGMTLRILATTDLHANLMAWDYAHDRSLATAGLALTAAQIAKARAEVPVCLLVDNGDFLQGSALGDFYGLEHGLQPGEVHPIIATMNLLAYDAATLGNHEFSHGLDFLMRAIDDASFPVVSANVARRLGATPDRDDPLISRHVMIERVLTGPTGLPHRLRIGIFGLCPPQVMEWEGERLSGHLAVRGMVEAGRAAAATLRAGGADIVIALSHSGITAAGSGDEAENASLALAMRADVDVLVAGHTHQLFPGPCFEGIAGVDAQAGTLAGKPAVMPGFNGSHLGVIDLTFRQEGGRLEITNHSVALRPIVNREASGLPVALEDPDARVIELAQPSHRATLGWTRRQVGTSSVGLRSHFTAVTDTPLARLVAEAKAAYLARIVGSTDLPILAAVSTFKAGGRGGAENYVDIPPGPLSIRHVADLYPHPNTVVGLRVTGAELADWLERGASQLRTVAPGGHDQPLIDEDFPSFNCDTIHGLTWRVDLSQPARFDARGALSPSGARRISAILHRGRPVAAEDVFILATNSYRAGGGGYFPATGKDARVILSNGKPIRSILADYLAAGFDAGSVGGAAAFRPDWRFMSMPGTSVLFDTAPEARAEDPDIAHFHAEDLGLQAGTGFRRFRLWL